MEAVRLRGMLDFGIWLAVEQEREARERKTELAFVRRHMRRLETVEEMVAAFRKRVKAPR